MATNLLVNPMIIQGSTTSYKTTLQNSSPNAGINNTSYGTLHSLLIDKIYWYDPQTVGDTIIIGDPNSGETLMQLRCETAGQSQVFDWSANPRLWTDFEINSFADAGSTLYIYYHLG